MNNRLRAFRKLPIMAVVKKMRGKIVGFVYKHNLEGNSMIAPIPAQVLSIL